MSHKPDFSCPAENMRLALHPGDRNYRTTWAIVQAVTMNAEECEETGKEKEMFIYMLRGIELES
jgi:hypothetical protein